VVSWVVSTPLSEAVAFSGPRRRASNSITRIRHDNMGTLRSILTETP
jgi:hypothetical protein